LKTHYEEYEQKPFDSTALTW